MRLVLGVASHLDEQLRHGQGLASRTDKNGAIGI